MAFIRGEEGAVKFKNSSGTAEAIVSTTGWSLDITKDTLDVTAHGATSRSFIGGLISGSGTIDFLYTKATGNETANLLVDVLTTEDAGDAVFELFLQDNSGSSDKKVTFLSEDPLLSCKNNSNTASPASSVVKTSTNKFAVSLPVAFVYKKSIVPEPEIKPPINDLDVAP